jgi:ribonucleoside-triphosphate reductase
MKELPTDFQTYIHQSKYARWRDDLGRRETWPETVQRYIDFWLGRGLITPEEGEHLGNEIRSLRVMPSMRALMTAGKALTRDEVASYNCSATFIDHPRKFDEIFYILMNGVGVGFSVERQYVAKLPEVPEELFPTETVIRVSDSKIGWASSLRELISLLYAGKVPSFDTSLVRPAGARLKVFGGRASGPLPLLELLNFTVATFKKAVGRKLTSYECHSLVCKIAEVVIVGSVRRSALISLSNLSDDRMRHAKDGQWWVENPHFSLANNSVCYTEKPGIGIFMDEWKALYDSKSGERGIFNRDAANKLLPVRRKELLYNQWLTNPCAEIVLRSGQTCNLSEVVVREYDSIDCLKSKIRTAAILGTLQATLTNFRYLSKEWKKNCEEERLLGVSLTGISDHPVLNGSEGADCLRDWLSELKHEAVETNKVWADRLGINQASAICAIKPSGTVSSLVNSAAGMHARHSEYYIRTVRSDKKDPLGKLMKDAGVPCEDDVMKPDNTWVFSFPIRAPYGAVGRKDRTAIQQLELWKAYQLHFCEHKPSITVSVLEHEWLAVGAWCYENFDILSGVSFLPMSDHSYRQAPYQECTEEEYEAAVAAFPQIPWDKLSEYEKDDHTSSSQEMACTSGACDIL